VGIGAAGGAGALYAAMGVLGLAPEDQARDYAAPRRSDFALTGRAAASVLIVGAGVSGLACAYELGKAGYRCTVLDARDRIGGRSMTLRGGDVFAESTGETQRVRFGEGLYFNSGPARIAQWMVTMDYCRELGVPLELFVNNNSAAYVYNRGMSAPVRARTARADIYGYISELLAKATHAGALDRRLTAADKERLLDFLTRFGDIGEKLSYAGSERRGFGVAPGMEPGAVLGPVPPLSQVLGQGLGRALTVDFSYEQAMPMFQPVGGMDAIAHALVRAVGADRIETGVRATKIVNLPDGVEVTCQGPDGVAVRKADYCVAALPPHVLARIPGNLGTPVVSALASARPTSAGKIGLEYDRRWWESDDRIYGGSTETDLDISRVWYPSSGFHGERGVVVGYYNTGANADRYAALAHAERHQRALTQGEKIHGEKYRTGVLSSASVAWAKQPHIEGAWVSWPSTAPVELLRQPAGRVYFAGDWLTHLIAWQAGALESARDVVTSLHRRVLAQSG
jgi:monoamine oxidase